MTVRARQPGIATGLPLGRMHADTRPTPAPAERAPCPRCGCNLSRYRDAWETHCAPCTRVLVTEGQLTLPPFEPEWQSSAEEARAAATAPRYARCRNCDKPLSTHNRRREQTGYCITCFNAQSRGEPSVCGHCGKPIARRNYNRAKNAGRTPSCITCFQRRRWGRAA